MITWAYNIGLGGGGFVKNNYFKEEKWLIKKGKFRTGSGNTDGAKPVGEMPLLQFSDQHPILQGCQPNKLALVAVAHGVNLAQCLLDVSPMYPI